MITRERIETIKAEHLRRRGERQLRLEAIATEQAALQKQFEALVTEAKLLQGENVVDDKATEQVIAALSEE